MSDDFEAYLERQLPSYLRDGPPPENWQGTDFGWQEVRDLAREAWRAQQALRFVEDVALRGMTSIEAASGVLAPGARLSALDGHVIRPLPGAPPELRDRALRILHDIGRVPVGTVDGILESSVRSVAFADGHLDRGIETRLTAAEAAIASYRARQSAERAQAAEGVAVVIHVPLIVGGHHYAAGRQTVSPAELEALERWREAMERQARERGWDAPVGFEGRRWPPFEIAATRHGGAVEALPAR